MKIVLIINIPAPYRVPVFEAIAKEFGKNFKVIFASKREPNRSWQIEDLKFEHVFLEESYSTKSDGFNYVHNNKDVLKHLWAYSPDVVITTGFNPTHLYGWLYTKLRFKKHVYMTDGTIASEKHLSSLHRFLRRIVFGSSHAFIGAGKRSKELFLSYNLPAERIFQSHLCVDNKRFENAKTFDERPFDLMYSGQITERKLPLLFAQIALQVAEMLPGLRVLVLGDGPLRDEFLQSMESEKIQVEYAGFVDQERLPDYYASAKLFLFTTRLDPWGVVVNEALASGTPVISPPEAGVSEDLVIDGLNGSVLESDSGVWSERIVQILQDRDAWRRLSD